MKIALFYSPVGAVGKPTGVGRHIVSMAGSLVRAAGVDELSLLAGRKAYSALNGQMPAALARLPVHYLPWSEAMMRRIQWLTSLAPVDRWAGDVDWVYCPKEQPVATRRARLAVMVHDLLAFEPKVEGLQSRPSRLTLLRWRLTMSRILSRAHLIATASRFTAERMRELLPISQNCKVVVVGNGVDPIFFRACQPSDSDILARYGVESQRYVLTVGSLTFRKAGDTILSMAQRLPAAMPGLTILVSGRRHDADLVVRYEAVQRENPRLPLRLCGYIPDADLAVLYSHALALLFPSRYEGFGIPALEAMAAGAPVIASRCGALPEVAGEAACYVSPDSPDEMINALRNLSDSASDRERFVIAGRAHAADCTWDRCAERLVEAMKAA